VRTVDEQLRLRRRGIGQRADARTEAAVLEAFIADHVLPAEAIRVSASDGTVTLSGRVDFPFQRDEAEAVARACAASLRFALTCTCGWRSRRTRCSSG
jgi:osmotically-inducible protein OsmY